jgi:peptide/nickel transport system permease protein
MAFGLVILIILSLMTIFASQISGEAVRTSGLERLLPPSGEHWFGTDLLGRDVYARTIQGSRISFIVGFSVAAITTVAGGIIGLIAGYFRRVDNIVMRFMDALMALPTILLALALIALLGSSVQNVIIAICVVETPRMVRIIRGSVLSLRDQAFVEAARSIGAPVWRILLFHIAPNTLAPALIQATFIFALAIIVEAVLSFVGAGTPPRIPSWGNIMAEGRDFFQVAYWVTFYPGVFLFLAVLSINLVGDGLRDALDPKLRRRV